MEINQQLLKRLSGGAATFPVATTDAVTLSALQIRFGNHIRGIKTIIAIGGDAVVSVLEEDGGDVLSTDKYLGYTANDNTIPQDCQVVANDYFTALTLSSGVVMVVIE